MQITVLRSDNQMYADPQAANHFFMATSALLVLTSEHNLKIIYQRGGDLLKSSKNEHEL